MLRRTLLVSALSASALLTTALPGLAADTKLVSFRGHSARVPADWPVIDFTKTATGCLRTDRHAVYLGTPRVSDCPPHLVGGLATVQLQEPESQTRRAAVTAKASASTSAGFDACTTPSTDTMSAWAASPYRTINAYVGGQDRGCLQPNLTSSWVSTVVGAGWRIIPTYVGLQAPCWGGSGATFTAANAAAQGSALADDAIKSMQGLGLPTGNPIYYDLESFDLGNSSCVSAVDAFTNAWTARLHARAYRSGFYSSAATGITRMVQKASDSSFHLPDDIWFAHWNDDSSVYGDSYVPDDLWADSQRIHQYQGGHQETWGGVTINIDSDSVDSDVAPASAKEVPDTTAPKVGVSPLPVYTTTSTVGLSWAGTDTQSGVSTYDVRYRRAGAADPAFTSYAYPTAWQSTAVRAIALRPAAGSTYCFQVRAQDRAGNRSAWSPERCTAAPLDERSLSASPGWARGTASAYFARTISRATSSHRTLTFPVLRTHQLSLLVTKCPDCGIVSVSLGGRLLRTLNLRSSVTAHQQRYPVATFGSVGAGQLVVRTVGTGRVYVDAVASTRA